MRLHGQASHGAGEYQIGELQARLYAGEPERVTELVQRLQQRHFQEPGVGEAVMQLEISSVPFVLFRNSKGGQTNVVYRRSDGNIGWVDPRPAA